MKIILAPDSMKGSLSAVEIVRIVAEAARRVFADVEIVEMPMADGGEGTVDALVHALGGTMRTVTVTGPVGVPVKAQYALLPDGETAVLEMAQASGLPHVPPDALDPLRATTRGTGEMLLHALDAGARHIYLGLGGSATNDGGMGFLAALGARFTDADGNPLPDGGGALERVTSVSLTGLDPRMQAVSITVLSDVTNPLLGPEGATAVYGPQKGVTEAMQASLEQGMAHYARVVSDAAGRDIAAFPGAGAAGGLGAALGGVLGAQIKPGIETVLDLVGFDAALAEADLVVTAEGRMDGQSVAYGKGPAGIARRAGEKGVPTLALVGAMTSDAMAFVVGGNASIMTTVNAPMPLEKALADAPRLLAEAAERMFRMVQIGRKMV